MPVHQQSLFARFQPVISAHPSLGVTDPERDIRWRIGLDAGYPSGLALETTLALQARLVQVYPVFLDANNLPIRDPRPSYRLTDFLPDTVQLEANLSSDIDVRILIQVPDSHTLIGEMQFTCKSSTEKKVLTGVCVRLNPLENGQVMSGQEFHNQTILAGETGTLMPVLMTGGLPKLFHRPYPGLSVQLLVSSRQPTIFRWVFNAAESMTLARENCIHSLNQSWAVTFKKASATHNQNLIQIQTGNPDWDEVLRLSQIQSQRFLVRSAGTDTSLLGLVHREPEDSSPHHTNASRWNTDSSTISAWDLYHSIRNFYLPGYPQVARDLLQTFVNSRQNTGNISFRPGIEGIPTTCLAPPLMAACCFDIYQVSQNPHLLAETYPALSAHVHRWLDSSHDHDQDRFPEWQSGAQTGWPENPLFDRWADKNKGYACSSVESPELGSLLFQECSTLATIAQALGKHEDQDHFLTLASEVKLQVEACWDARKKSYRYRDRDTHLIPGGENISRGKNSGTFSIQRTFTHATRICLTVHCKENTNRPITAQLIGKDQAGNHLIEQVSQQLFVWRDGRSTITSEHVFLEIESISLTGLSQQDEWTVHEMDLSQVDLSCFMPLWAGIPSAENAARMVQFNLAPNWIEHYPGGIPMIPLSHQQGKAPDSTEFVLVPQVCMLTEGLFRYGFTTEANKLVNGLMEAIIKSYRTDGQIFQQYHSLTGKGSGKPNHLSGLAPVGLFLRNLGVEIHSDHEVVAWGKNPYPQDVMIQYKGLRIIRAERDMEITFQNGEKIRLDGPEKRIIRWKTNGGGK